MVSAELRDGKLYFEADSVLLFTKGVAGLLIRVFSGQTPHDIVNANLDFIDKIGLTQHLSPTRSNGLLSMVKQIKYYALAYDGKITRDMGKSLMEDLVIEKLSTVYDPEVPVNIWELGLVYSIEFPKQNEVIITMTLTAPGCPIADQIVPGSA